MIPFVESQMRRFIQNADGSQSYTNAGDKGSNMSVKEDINTWNEAKTFLKRMAGKRQSLDALKWSDGLALAAQDHCNDRGSRGGLGHDGSDGSTPDSRIRRYVVPKSMTGENLAYGRMRADEFILQLYIDDGVPDRGHRKNLVHTGFTHIGVAHCPHIGHRNDFGEMVSISYANFAGEPVNTSKGDFQIRLRNSRRRSAARKAKRAAGGR